VKHNLDVFRNPEYREAAVKSIQDLETTKDGYLLYEILKDLLTKQGEWDFEQEVKDFPHGLEIDRLGDENFGAGLTQWLDSTVGKDNYVLMPRSAFGKYHDKWNWVFFKQKDHAALFKLTWL
jgi:hypothetical protein